MGDAITDESIQGLGHLKKIFAAYVIRCQEGPIEVIEERGLSQAAREARVISDQIVRLGHSRREVGSVDHPVRRIAIEARSQGQYRASRPSSDRIVLLASLTDVPAEVIAARLTGSRHSNAHPQHVMQAACRTRLDVNPLICCE